MNAVAYTILAKSLVHHHGKESTFAQALGKDSKGKISLAIYATAIFAAFINSWISLGLYTLVAIIWLVPDKRFEDRILAHPEHAE